MDMIYHWRFNDPDNTLHMHIENHQEAKVFDATLALRREPLTRPRCARCCCAFRS
jgi:DUF1365 family protein